MDAKLKEAWVKALRSGEYEQTQRALRNNGSYCCLGVLCDVMGCEWLPGEGDRSAILNGELNSYFLEKSALESSGMVAKEQERLADMNDVGAPFTEIADYIESNL